jgi:hypothetical protein
MKAAAPAMTAPTPMKIPPLIKGAVSLKLAVPTKELKPGPKGIWSAKAIPKPMATEPTVPRASQRFRDSPGITSTRTDRIKEWFSRAGEILGIDTL